jgi:O-antigen/teichoic acid export membrane protein
MRYLAIVMLLNLLNSTYSSQLLATNNPGIHAKINIAGIILNTILLFIFIPTSIFGIGLFGLSYTGAAIACVISTAFIAIITRMIVKRLTGTRSNPRILIHVAAAVVEGALLFTLSVFIKIEGLLTLVGYGLLSVALFSGMLWIFRELTMKDVRFFFDTINPVKLRIYISEEMKEK